ncbi:hypothetical protein [Lagierella sp.]|uniref:hypothetical protein n=1 Tax=Lagierella sp. TaxID=2849657 RepID=UPI002618CBA2|nr:hypothetical protein [Lagierella sp.]
MEKRKQSFLVKAVGTILLLAILFFFKGMRVVQLGAIGVFQSYLVYDELKERGNEDLTLRLIIMNLIFDMFIISILWK